MFKYYNSNCHCKTEHVEKYKNSTFASKAAKRSDQEQLYDLSHLHLKNPVNSLMGSLSSGIWWTFLR